MEKKRGIKGRNGEDKRIGQEKGVRRGHGGTKRREWKRKKRMEE